MKRRLAVPGDESRANQVSTLGEDHPLVRVERSIHHLTNHAITCAGFVVASPGAVLMNRETGVVLAAAAAAVGLVLCGAIGALRGIRRSRIHDLILAGDAPALPVVLHELGRLGDRGYLAQLAAALERALDQGERWHEFLPASRPPCGVRHLPAHAPAIRQIAAALRRGEVTPRAVVLVDRLMRGGYGAAIYGGGPDRLGRELGRIGFELGSAPSARSR